MPFGAWQPTRFVRFEHAFDTSMGTSLVVTDAGKAYLKAMGNRQGPHALASEWVGTRLADRFGLQTFDYALLELDELDEIPFPRGGLAHPGPAFITRAESGNTWGGDDKALDRLVNPDDVAKLVVFDTWTRNCDRHPPSTARRPNYDNVFLSGERVPAGRSRLIAMDHTHCFTCGRDMDAHIAAIGAVRDPSVYGLFPGFVPRVTRASVTKSCAKLREVTVDGAEPLVHSIPAEWEVTDVARAALIQLIVERAAFVADTIEESLAPYCWPPVDRGLF